MNSKSVYLLIYIDKINNKENKYNTLIFKSFNTTFREI